MKTLYTTKIKARTMAKATISNVTATRTETSTSTPTKNLITSIPILTTTKTRLG